MRILAGLTFCALLASTGCLGRNRNAVPAQLSRPSGMISTNPSPDHPHSLELDVVRSFAERRRAEYLDTTNCKRKSVLALSGGGMYGSYSVGILCGWTDAGTRPQFDIVTGVSTGAVLATYAFLGSAYDAAARDAYTSISNRDIFRLRLGRAPLLRDAVATSEPLRNLIDRYLTDEVMAAVAAEHMKGRRLYFGTTNLDTRQLVVWDMGAIATSSKPNARELYRDIILASSSPPGFLPPVKIEVEINGRRYTELHCDGGATAGVFLKAPGIDIDDEKMKQSDRPLAGTDVYVIVAGKLYSDPVFTRNWTLGVGQNALSSLIYSQTRSELFRIYSVCLLSGMNYHQAAIPQDVPVSSDALSFDPATMKRLYEAGYEAALNNRAWRNTPPGAEPWEQTKPRTGTQFLAPGVR